MRKQIPSFPRDDLAALARELAEAPDNALQERAWDVHGTGVRLAADHDSILNTADRLLGVFPPLQKETRGLLRLVVTTRRQWTVPQEAIVLPPSSHEIVDPREAYGVDPRFSRCGNMNYYEFSPMGGAAYDLEKGVCVGFLNTPESFRPWLIEHLILQMLLLETLRGQGLFWLHAACVECGGKAVLFIGHSGSGKTTSCLNLASSGFGFLGEDRIFIRSESQGVVLLSYPRDMAVTRETLAILPALRDRVDQAFTSRKLRISAATLFPDSIRDSAGPGLILFPHVVDADQTTFQPLPPALAICRILPNSLLASHPGVSSRHFQTLSSLAGASRAYEVMLGRDIGNLPDLVRRVLADEAAS